MFGHTQISTEAIDTCLKHYEAKLMDDGQSLSGWGSNVKNAKHELELIKKYALTRIAKFPHIHDLIDEYCNNRIGRKKESPNTYAQTHLLEFAYWLFNMDNRVYCTAHDCIKCEHQSDNSELEAKMCSEPYGFCKLQKSERTDV